MATESEMTGAQAGLSGEEQIRACLRRMVANGGQAAMPELYEAVEERMGRGRRLSDSGKAYVRHCINQVAVRAGFVYAHDPKSPGWRIAPEGRDSVEAETITEEVVNAATGETEQQLANSAAGRAFELYMLELLRRMYPHHAWYHQGVHQRHERGLDFIGSPLGAAPSQLGKIGVQVKFHSPNRIPSAVEWSKFFAGCFGRSVNTGLFVTTGRLSAIQRREADQANVTVIEGRDEVKRIAALYGLSAFDLFEEEGELQGT